MSLATYFTFYTIQSLSYMSKPNRKFNRIIEFVTIALVYMYLYILNLIINKMNLNVTKYCTVFV